MAAIHSFLEGWRRVLGEHFFRPEQAGQNVSLCIDSDLLQRLADENELDDLVESIEDDCRILAPRRRNPLDLALDQLIAWDRSRREGFPPYVPILAFLIAAANHNAADAADHSYWSRVQQLREERIGHVEALSTNRKVVEMLFRDLARWASSDNQGRLGRFDFRRFGQLRYVGLVRAQSILSPSDVRAIHRAFSENDFSAIRPPSRRELLQAALSVRNQLRPSLARLLEQWPRDSMSEAALDRIEDVLQAWDGELDSGTTLSKRPQRVLPVVLEFRPVGRGGLRSFLRVASGAEDVPDELLLSTAKGTSLLARFDAGDLSQPIEDLDGEQPLDAASFDWTAGIRLTVQNSATISVAHVPARSLRFFVLQGRAWTETAMLPSHAACLLASSNLDRSLVEKWLSQHGGQQPFTVVSPAPVPPGWTLLRLERRPSESPRCDFPLPGLLAGESSMIRLFGGVRTGRNSFASYALPDVELVSAGAELRLQLADVFDTRGHKLKGVQLLQPTSDQTYHYQIAADDQIWGDLAGFRLEAVDAAGDVQVSRTVQVGEIGAQTEQEGARNKWGQIASQENPSVWGLKFTGQPIAFSPAIPVGRPLPPTSLPSSADRFVRILATRNSLSWPVASRTARAILESDGRELDWSASRSISLQFEGMRLIGALEVREDASGRFAKVSRLGPYLHLLPSRAPIAGRFPLHAVFSGTYSARLRDQLFKAAQQRSIDVHIQRQPPGCWLVPDCVSLFADHVDAFSAVAKIVGCDLMSLPFAAAIAQWLESPGRFVEVAPWRNGPAPHAQTRLAFCPHELRLRHEAEVAGDLVFFECREPYAEQLWTYWLYDRCRNRHCECPRQLGRWITFLLRPSPPKGLPTSATGELYLPIELRPPQLVERAVCACSGLTAALVTFPAGMRHLTDLGYPEPPSTPAEWFRASSRVYSGHWLRFERVRNSPLISSDASGSRFGALGLPLAQVPIAHSSNLEVDNG